MPSWHFIHLLMDEICSFLLNLFPIILQLISDNKKIEYFSFIH
jgi:hypothetical protein